MAVPVQVVGVGRLHGRRNGRGAELEADVLSGGGREGDGCAEVIVLVQTCAEGAIVIDFDGRGVNLITADEDGLLAGRNAPLGVKLPFDPEEVGGLERVLLRGQHVEALPYPETEFVCNLSQDVEVQVISHEAGVVCSVHGFLMESGTGVYGYLVHMEALAVCKGAQAESDGGQNDFSHG